MSSEWAKKSRYASDCSYLLAAYGVSDEGLTRCTGYTKSGKIPLVPVICCSDPHLADSFLRSCNMGCTHGQYDWFSGVSQRQRDPRCRRTVVKVRYALIQYPATPCMHAVSMERSDAAPCDVSDLLISIAVTGTHGGIPAQVFLDVGVDDVPVDTISRLEILLQFLLGHCGRRCTVNQTTDSSQAGGQRGSGDSTGDWGQMEDKSTRPQTSLRSLRPGGGVPGSSAPAG